MMVDPKLVKAMDGFSMLPPKKTTTTGKALPPSLSLPSIHSKFLPPLPKPLGYTLVTLGSTKNEEDGKHHVPIKERTHRLVLAYTFGPPPSKSLTHVLHTCETVGCHQPHHLLYGNVADNNLKGAQAIRRYTTRAMEQGRIYYGKGEEEEEEEEEGEEGDDGWETVDEDEAFEGY